MKTRKLQTGITILELLLVLALGSVMLIMGFNLYNQFSLQAHQARLLGNVDQLFQAMAHYYQANCRLRFDINGKAVSLGTLDPLATPSPSDPFILHIVTGAGTPNLTDQKFLSSWQPNNPLIDNTPVENGYYVQLNRLTNQTTNVNACTGSTSDQTTWCTGPSTLRTQSLPTSQVVIWQMQVAVKLLDPTQATTLAQQLNATCISTAASDSGPVSKCQPPPAAGGYLVWVRSMTYISNNTSDFWPSQPSIKQFNMQYTNDSMQLLNGTAQTLPSGFTTQNYLCGD